MAGGEFWTDEEKGVLLKNRHLDTPTLCDLVNFKRRELGLAGWRSKGAVRRKLTLLLKRL